ncbi:glutaminyl-peptide cyclotransferase [Streptomyces sp. NPDC060031]|uniref:glutaminyl-peptide cyclotransferase n=1 Tax=Streptomyces sp. NPDC060031 TaxID=3347043 RepID=UPI00367BA768
MAATPVHAAAGPRIQFLRAIVRDTLPHDPRAFTQGLEFRGATLYESTGLVGESSVRAGLPGKPPSRRVDLPAPYFGEGITLSRAKLWQLTWDDGIAIERDPVTLLERRRVSFRGEGWGLCHQRIAGRERLVMSDGSDRLTFRDPDTFTATGGINVRQDGAPATQLNELECAPDGSIYANVHMTDTILRIDPRTGTVTADIDATGLLAASERREDQQLNGIAAVPGTNTFLLTGKLWPHMFQVSFDPRRAIPAAAAAGSAPNCATHPGTSLSSPRVASPRIAASRPAV